MDEEKEVARLCHTLIDAGLFNAPIRLKTISEAVIKAGYRKADEVRRETIREIWERISNVEGAATESAISYSMKVVAEFERIFAKYGIEVDE